MEQRGLSAREAAELLPRDGPNELPSEGPRSPLRTALHMLEEEGFLTRTGDGRFAAGSLMAREAAEA